MNEANKFARDALIQKRDELSRNIVSFQEQIKTFEENIRQLESVLPLFPEPLIDYDKFPGLQPSSEGLSQVIGPSRIANLTFTGQNKVISDQ